MKPNQCFLSFKVPQDKQASQDHQEPREIWDQQAHKDFLGHQVNLDLLDFQAEMEHQETQEIQEQLEQQDFKEAQVHQANLDSLEEMERQVVLEPQDLLVHRDSLDLLACLGLQVPPDLMD